MGSKLLVVDDEPAIGKAIKRYLENYSFSVLTATNGAEALLMIKESAPDVVLSDAEMPGLDGHSLCRVLRGEVSTQSIPLILMSGKMINEPSILAGFEGGADDYLLKPFSMPVLMARIDAVLRRSKNGIVMEPKLRRDGLEIDPAGRAVRVKGRSVTLTRKEFDLLSALLSRAGRVLSVPYLLETVWGYDTADYNDSSTVEAHISHLRKKLGPDFGRRIVNMTGHGYKFED